MARFSVTILVLGLAACSNSKKDASKPAPEPEIAMDKPRATADAIIEAYEQRSPKIATSLMPSDDLLRKSFDCPNDELVKAVKELRAAAAKRFGEGPKDRVVEIGAFDKSGSGDRQLRVGDEYEGCKAKTLATVHDSRVDLRITTGGKTSFEEETWSFIKLGDDPKWYHLR